MTSYLPSAIQVSGAGWSGIGNGTAFEPGSVPMCPMMTRSTWMPQEVSNWLVNRL